MLVLREAKETDMDLLYHWANDPDVRQNSFNSDSIPYKEHVSWFNNMMANTSVLQFIMMDEGVPVGQIRLTINNDEAEIGYSIDKEYRGKGYGHSILKLVKIKITEQYPNIKKLVAKVKPENDRSNKLFRSEGYETKYLYYVFTIGGDKEN